MELVSQLLHTKGNLLDLFGRRVELGPGHEIGRRTASIEGAIVATGGQSVGETARRTETSDDIAGWQRRERTDGGDAEVGQHRDEFDQRLMELAQHVHAKGRNKLSRFVWCDDHGGSGATRALRREGGGEHTVGDPDSRWAGDIDSVGKGREHRGVYPGREGVVAAEVARGSACRERAGTGTGELDNWRERVDGREDRFEGERLTRGIGCEHLERRTGGLSGATALAELDAVGVGDRRYGHHPISRKHGGRNR